MLDDWVLDSDVFDFVFKRCEGLVPVGSPVSTKKELKPARQRRFGWCRAGYSLLQKKKKKKVVVRFCEDGMDEGRFNWERVVYHSGGGIILTIPDCMP